MKVVSLENHFSSFAQTKNCDLDKVCFFVTLSKKLQKAHKQQNQKVCNQRGELMVPMRSLYFLRKMQRRATVFKIFCGS